MRDLMQRARELAERGRYTAAPNPLVGAVVVRDGEILGEGYHARAGGEHAEALALEQGGPAARGAEMYVTLEPCNHHGRTPPCTEAILRAGVSRVVIGALDPDPRMRGDSVELLRESGVEVEVLDNPLVRLQNEQYFHARETGRPFVHLKLAATLDGRISAADGAPAWITGKAARLRAHQLRAEAGAVLVGAGTVRADDPLLTARELSEEPPEVPRIVLDPRLTISPDRQLIATAREAPVLIFAAEDSLDGREKELRERGAEVIPTAAKEGELDLAYVLGELGRRGLRGVLVEGGSRTVVRFAGRGLVDKLTLFYAPRLSGSGGVPMFGELGLGGMEEPPRLSVSRVESFGEDLALTLYPAEEKGHVHRTG